MKYKAIIFDLDGTAISNYPSCLPSTKMIDVVRDASTSLTLCAATGRPLRSAKPILDALELKHPCVIAAGTQIIDPRTSKVLWEATMEHEDVHRVLKVCEPYDYEILIRNELRGEGAQATRQVEGPVNVMYIMGCTYEDAEVLMRELSRIPSITAAEVKAWWCDGLDIHITHKEATKEHAIAELLKLAGLSSEETVGVGDGNNDVHLFRGVGLKVAMGNATELLKSQADVVCGDVENDGLAEVIEQCARGSWLAGEPSRSRV